jgi:CDP-diacylglycerol--serine O-phosphatidyltransferase
MRQDQDPPSELTGQRAALEHDRVRHAMLLLPNALTLGAVLCGLTAVRLSGEGRFVLAMGAIFGAVLLDVADGFAARRLSAQTAIGAELDSLADFLNFGIAPAMLLYDRHLHLLGGGGWIVATIYVLATGLRLARFNVQLAHNCPSKWFRGLPSTGAAVAVITADAVANLGLQAAKIPAVIAGVTITASVLMLSKLRVPSLSTIFSRPGRNL